MTAIRLGLAVPSSTYAGAAELRDATLEGEQLAEAINNTLQSMWRATRAAAIPIDSLIARRINDAIGRWEVFWDGFKDALLERQFDFGLGLWGTDWGQELKTWQARTLELDEELRQTLAQQVQAGTIAPEQAQEYARGLQERGVDATLQEFRQDVARSDKPPLFLLALAGVGALIGAGLYLGRRRRRRR